MARASFLRGKRGAVIVGLLGALLLAAGISMHLRGDVHVGPDIRTSQPNVVSGPYVGFVGGLLVIFSWSMWRKKGKS